MTRQREHNTVARSYAQALLGIGRQEGKLPLLDQQARTMAEAFAKAPGAIIFLDNPQVPTEDKLEYLGKVFGGRLEPVLDRMLGMLVRRDRIRHLVEILEYFSELVEREQGIGYAVVETARALGEDERRRLSASFERYTGHRLRIDWKVEPRLIGGIVFRFRDLLIDSSLLTRLGDVRERLLGAQVLTVK